MKRTIWLFLLLLPSLVSAQTQQGIVKTRGRMVNGKHIQGKRLSGATVQVKARAAVVSNTKGEFSFPVPSKTFMLQSVQKLGYVLTDPDVLSKQYAYSKDPLILVLESPSQHADDKLAAEKKIRRTLQHFLQEKEDEIESLKTMQKLSDDEYRKQLQELYNQQENNEKLIVEMADRYSKMDFDVMDEFNRKISSLILEGNLIEADSLLNSKGDFDSRAAALREHQDANAQAEKEIKKRQKILEKSKAMAEKELKDLAQDCVSKYEIFKMQHLNDSASYYLKKRASLDTTKIEWQYDVAHFLYKYLADYSNSKSYFSKIIHFAHNHDANVWRAQGLRGLANVLCEEGKYDSALPYVEQAIQLEDSIYNHQKEVATLYNFMGQIYHHKGDYMNARSYYERALKWQESNLEQNNEDVAESYNCLGSLYDDQKEFEKSLFYLDKARQIKEMIYGEKSPEVATVYNNIGLTYSMMREFAQSLSCHFKALEIRKLTFGSNHPSLSYSYNNIGYVYANSNKEDSAMIYYEKALNIRIRVLGENHPMVATIYNNIGYLYQKKGDFQKALEILQKTLSIQKNIYGEKHPYIAMTYHNIGTTYKNVNKFEEALNCYNRAKALYLELLPSNHPNIKTVDRDILEVERTLSNP